MSHKKIYSIVSIAISLLLSTPAAVKAQTSAVAGSLQPVAARLTQPINEKSLVALKGTVHPLASTANDRGTAPDGMQLDRIQVVLKRSDAQETTLKQLISDLHTPGTANYHKWLTPAQFGQQFGPSDTDVATLETWLQSHGFGNFKLNPGQQTLEFSGSAAQFSSTFHTQIHKYVVNGETHYANSVAPQIPAALTPVFGGFASLNNFRVKSHSKMLGKGTYDAKTDTATPQWTVGSSSGVNFILAPADFAVQYDLNPLYTAGTNGNGQTIAIVNDSNINVSLVNSFRTLFNLPANPPQVIIDGNDPGIDGVNNPDGPNGDSLEAYLDVEWSGAVAQGSNIDLVIAADTALESGLILAAEHAVYSNVAPVISLSFGDCEAALGSGNTFLSNLWEQAAAQGITVAVSTGDSGSAGCDNDNTQDYAVSGQAVSGYASTPYNVAVGGTDFYYSSWNQSSSAINTQLATYWNFTPSNSTPAVSIKGVIPEQPWNNSQYGLNVGGYTGGETTIAAGSGGASTLGLASTVVAGDFVPYPKPTWQTGTGVPADKARDLPDVSLFAANYANYSYYPVCAVDGDCQPGSSAVQFTGVGGTSASTPSFAGMMALVNQKYGPQGQADFVLYPLAAQFPAAFHDIVNGTNSVPCNTTPVDGLAPDDCIAVSNPVTDTDPTYGATVEGQIGTGTTPEYNATVGYDLATGLGTIDANVMVTNWGNVKFASSTTTLTPSSTSFTHGTSITVSGSVTASTTPTGSVALMTNSTEPLQAGETTFTLSNGTYSGSLNFLPGGTYSIWGQYSGDGVNGSSTSSKTSITVAPEASSLYFNVLNSATGSTNGTAIAAGSSVPYGTQLLLSGEAMSATYYTNCLTAAKPPASCSAGYGTPTGTVSFSDGGTLLNKAVVNAEGDAEYNAPFAVGSHSVTASYSGDNSYNSSSAAAIAFTVTKDTPALGFSSPSATNAAGTAFQGGEPITFTIQVENFANNTNEQNNNIAFYSPVAAPTGTVTISGLPSGVPTSATLQAALDTSTIFPEGVGAITAPATTPAGSYTATVSYPGDANYNSTSQTFQVVILAANSAKLPSTTTLTSTATTTSPTAQVIVTATVTGQTGKAAPTGTVTFVSSGNLLGSLNLTTGSADVSTAAVALNSSISSLLPGANLITVQYSGDSVYQPSSATITITNGTVSQGAASFTLSAPAIAIASQGASGTSIVTVAPSNGFTGSVALSCAATSSPTGAVSTPTCSFAPASASVTGTSSVISTLTVATTATTTAGTYTFTVTGTSGSLTQTANVTVIVSGPSSTPSFALGGTTPITITSAGASGTSPITITPSAGFTGTVTLSCAVTSSPTGATDTPTCAVTTAPPAITGTAVVTGVITISTTAAPTGVLNGSIQRILPIGGSITMAAFLFFVLPVRRRGLKALLGMLLLAIIGGAAIGCGGGSSSSGGTTTGGGTTAGAYTVTVTGSNSAVTPSPTTTISVTVQ